MLDKVYVVETYDKRAKQLEAFFTARRGFAEEVVLMQMDAGKVEDAREKFRYGINESLRKKHNVMVLFNCIAGVRGQVLSILREAEEIHDKGTRRIMVSCLHSRKLHKGFRKRGISLDGVYHVRYDDDGYYLDKLARVL